MPLNRTDIEALMKGVASALQPTLAGIERRASSTDELLADIEQRLSVIEAQCRAMMESRYAQQTVDS